MTKKELETLETATSQVEDAIALLEDAQETLVHADPKFEFPVGIIFSAQTSLRVFVELAKDAGEEAAPAKGKKRGATRKAAPKKAAPKRSAKKGR